jgi:RHS repeat-associated protein
MAQDIDDVQSGIKAYGTYRGGDIDSVSMTNGNLIADIPLVSFPQRGKAHLGFKLIYNRKAYRQKTECNLNGCTTLVFVNSFSTWVGGNAPMVAVPAQGLVGGGTSVPYNGAGGTYMSYSITAPDGASHQLAPLSSTDYETVDGTALHYHQPSSGSAFSTDSDGTRYTFVAVGPPIQITQEDANGNQISIPSGGGYLDTVGRTIPPLPSSVGSGGSGTCPSGALPVNLAAQWVVPGPNNVTSTFTFCWAKVHVITIFSFPPNSDPTENYGDVNYLQSVVLPNGTAWNFQYSNDGYGDLTQITFPTGGTLSYTWINGVWCGSLVVGPRQLATRTLNANDGTGNHTWNYSFTNGGATVTDPLGNHTVYTNTYESACSAYTTQIDYYQGAVGSSNLLKTVATAYFRAVSPFVAYPTSGVYMNIVPTQVTTTWAANGKTSQETKTYDSGFTFTSPIPGGGNYTGLYGKVIAQKEYDYGTTSGVPGPLLKQTNTTYAWQSSNPNYATYLNNNMMNLVYSSQITDGTSQKAYTQYGYDEASIVASGMGATQNLDTAVWTGSLRGNQTSVNRWRNLPSVATLSNTTTYYNTGMPSVAKDPLLNPTTYSYSSTFQDAYVTQVQNALSQSTYHNYDYNTGLITSTTDPNSQVTTNSYDIGWRLTNVTRPTGGGQTSFCYTDVGGSTCSPGSPPYQVVINKAITSAKNETVTAIVDGLGRLSQTQLNSDPENVDYVDDGYDGEGNKSTTSNPYRTTSDSTYGITTNTYDALRRVTQVTQADGSLLKTAYCANTTLVTDEAGHWRRSTVDGLGRLVEVDEPNSPTATVNSNGCPGTGEPIWVTTYGYDTLGNLITVLQAGSRSRTFSYDSLSRLLSASNPESGNLAYTYDANGNVTTKVTPQQNQTGSATTTLSYCYDSLDRMTSKAYTNQSCPMTTPVATYTYDGSACLGAPGGCSNIGHRTGMTDAAGSESWAYDTMGRAVVQSRITNSKTKTTSYTYNLDGSVATLAYPSGRVVTYIPDTAGRPSNVMDNTTSVYYATGSCVNGVSGSGVCYAPQDAVAQIQNGASLVSTHIYNDRLQPCWMYSTTGTPLAWGTTGCSSTATAANMLDLKYNFNLGADNGNPISITNNRVADRSQSFTYDQLNRVVSAQTSATHSSDPAVCWGQAFGYDSTGNWSNLLSISGASSAYSGCTQGSLTVSVSTKNQIVGDTYDAAGNLIAIPSAGATYVYDAENELCNLAGTDCSSPAYIYDGDDNRVEKSGSKLYWYSGSEVLDETDQTGSVTNANFSEYVFFGGNRIARRDHSNNVFYYLTDQLGSSRMIVQGGQTTFCYDADFEPFGGEHTYTNTCPQNYKFTGKERDTESGLDNFGARYYASTTGRFMSPDWALKPVSVPYAKFGDPQTLNLYTYVENSPLNRIDADGHADNKDTSGRVPPMPTCYPHTQPCPQHPEKDKVAAAQNKATTKPGTAWLSPRATLALKGTANLIVAAGKGVAAAGAGLAGPETGGLTVPLAIYAGIGAAGNFTAGLTQLAGAVTGKEDEANKGADAATAVTTVSGAITLARTGDITKAANAAAVEGVFTSGFTGGATGNPLGESAIERVGTVIDTSQSVQQLTAPDQQ